MMTDKSAMVVVKSSLLKEGGGDNSGKCDDAKAKQSGRWFGFLIFSGCILKNYLNGNCFFLFLFV